MHFIAVTQPHIISWQYVAMSSFKMNQVRCTSISTIIGNSIALVSHLSIVTKAKGTMV